MIHSELLQFTTLYKLVKYDDTIYVVILDIDLFFFVNILSISTTYTNEI